MGLWPLDQTTEYTLKPPPNCPNRLGPPQIKQNLRIKRFFGTSENAVKTQVWIAVSVYVLIATIRKRLNLERSLYTLLQVLSVSVFEKTPLIQLLSGRKNTENTLGNANQLNLFD